MTTNTPIRVGGQVLPDSVIQGTIRSPIVVTDNSANNLLNIGAGIGSNTRRSQLYKVKLTSNGRVFNMLLPPSIETKHPGKSNPLQMPGLQIEASAAISKLKIPGFFPIYQHLGVETLTVSMSGMFTGYDGIDVISNALDWEGWESLSIKEGQDSYTAANELYEFAVRNKSLIEVTIYTSDGSFFPKKSTATTFRDDQSNIRFKGYIKDFKQIYIRQDRNYYLLRFEIIDLTTGTKICKSDVKSNKKEIITTETTSSNNYEPITDEDRKYRSKDQIEIAEKIKALIDKNIDIKEIEKEYNKIPIGLRYQLLLYAESKNYNVDNNFKQLLNIYETTKISDIVIKTETDLYKEKKFKETAEALCNRFKDSCVNTKKLIEASKKDIDNYVNSNNTTASSTKETQPISPSTPLSFEDQTKAIVNNNLYPNRLKDLVKLGRFTLTKDQVSTLFKSFIVPKGEKVDGYYMGNSKAAEPIFILCNESGLECITTIVKGSGNNLSLQLKN